ncbi:MAG: SDR family oxidoreductase [Planctomycetia bacterium]|nr:SDR family oxidoreductase [Planctomycetia bacterium]
MPDPRPRLLVIGAGGFVGSWVARLARDEFDVVEGARRPRAVGSAAESTIASPARVAIDITQSASVRAAFDEARPEFVVLTAAIADIDRCEREPDLANEVNHEGPVHVARECRECGARLVFTSSDAVFDGTKHAYREDDPPTPINHYGRTKARAEASIQEILPASAAVVRPSQVLGFAPVAGTNSYLNKLAETLRAGRTVQGATFEFRNPIDAATLGRVLLDVVRSKEASGVFHAGASDKMSRYEMARALAKALGVSPDLVLPQHEPAPDRRAPRGPDDFLVCERLPRLCGFAVPTCAQVIERAVHGTA